MAYHHRLLNQWLDAAQSTVWCIAKAQPTGLTRAVIIVIYRPCDRLPYITYTLAILWDDDISRDVRPMMHPVKPIHASGIHLMYHICIDTRRLVRFAPFAAAVSQQTSQLHKNIALVAAGIWTPFPVPQRKTDKHWWRGDRLTTPAVWRCILMEWLHVSVAGFPRLRFVCLLICKNQLAICLLTSVVYMSTRF